MKNDNMPGKKPVSKKFAALDDVLPLIPTSPTRRWVLDAARSGSFPALTRFLNQRSPAYVERKALIRWAKARFSDAFPTETRRLIEAVKAGQA